MIEIVPWRVRSQPLRQRTGIDLFNALYSEQPIAALLESPGSESKARNCRYSICAGQPRRPPWTPPLGQILPTLKQLPRTSTPALVGPEAEAATELPFTGGWLGWLGYDLAWEIETLPYLRPDQLPFPVAFWYEPDSFAILDHLEQRLWLAAADNAALDALEYRLDTWSAPAAMDGLTLEFRHQTVAPFTLDQTQAAYETAVRKAKAHIQAGDIFQANLSLRFQTQTNDTGWSLYRRLRSINPSPFACYYRTPWGEVISCSPERLIHLRDRRVETRPIAGTHPRGHTPEQDRQLAKTLHTHPKEVAEHIMLVDLERNDLGRVCKWGSVRVNELLTLEYYSHVMHLVSNVVGALDPSYDGVDLIRAVFPGGTITGCPKVRCMEIIETLESSRRSLFYGSCGYLDYRGHLDLNILIRTLLSAPTAMGHTVWGQVGAGIVADSDPHREWLEALQKAQAQLLALGFSTNPQTAIMSAL